MITPHGSELARGAALLLDLFYPLKGRRALNAADKARARWTEPSDGVNRAGIRKEMAQIPRTARAFKRAQMTHAKDIVALKQASLPDVAQEAPTRNLLKARRKSRV